MPPTTLARGLVDVSTQSVAPPTTAETGVQIVVPVDYTPPSTLSTSNSPPQLISDAASGGGYGTRYYTYKAQVPLKPGQKIGFTPGRGYYAYYPTRSTNSPVPPTSPKPSPIPPGHPKPPPPPPPPPPGPGPVPKPGPTGTNTGTAGIVDAPNLDDAKGKVPIKVLTEHQPYPWTSPSHPAGPHYSNAQLRSFGATPDEIWIIDHESSGYTHAWNPIRNDTGYAYGLGQITGLFRLQYFGANWEGADPHVQIKMMQAYIRYGSYNFHDDAGAIAFWKANGWY